MPHLCACHRFKESLEQELERSWTAHELWFHQPSVPSTSVHRKWRAGFKILDATGGPQQRNSHWKLLISKLALSPLCFKSSHISNCLASVFMFLSRLTWLHPWLHPWWPRSNWKRYPFGATRPALGPTRWRGHWRSSGRWAKATWGFNNVRIPQSPWGMVIRKPYSKVDLQQPANQAEPLLIWITCKEDSLDTRQVSSLFRIQETFQDPRFDEVGRVMKFLRCPPKKTWTKKAKKKW